MPDATRRCAREPVADRGDVYALTMLSAPSIASANTTVSKARPQDE
jgi:hypothetical protein